jgi:hypothetical protein
VGVEALPAYAPDLKPVEWAWQHLKPTHRIIHLRDRHYVRRELFRQDADRPLSDEEASARHRAHVLEVELVQLEQEALLRCLVKHHGLKRILTEGLTAKGLPAYREVIAALRETDKELADLREQRAQVKKPAPAIDQQIEELVRGHRRQLLEYGAAARLALAGQVEVLPLDDEELLEQAKPVKGKLDAAKVEARHDGQVRAALESGPCSLLILGGGHGKLESWNYPWLGKPGIRPPPGRGVVGEIRMTSAFATPDFRKRYAASLADPRRQQVDLSGLP